MLLNLELQLLNQLPNHNNLQEIKLHNKRKYNYLNNRKQHKIHKSNNKNNR